MVSFLSELTALLAENGIPDARFEAQCLTGHITRNAFTPPTPEQAAEIQRLSQRRIAGEPLQGGTDPPPGHGNADRCRARTLCRKVPGLYP